jgi:MFS family permease
VDLRLFQHREITIAVIAMALFAIAFFGATLLFPLYFQQVHGESPLKSGWLLAPQGFGAMITMPIAGVLADKIGPGKVVLTGLVLDTVGMAFFGFVGSQDSYAFLLTGLVIMGLGMGATMMPIMSAALARLTDASIARGSTLMNITQQVASSIGTALFSVLLTSALHSHPNDLGGSYGRVFLVATVLVAVCLVPALFLPRTKTEAPVGAPVPVH